MPARLILSACLALGLIALPAAPKAQEAPEFSFFTLAGGDIGGNYFAAARVICRELNDMATGTLRCSPEATPGSVYNISGLRSHELDFAIVQSDWLKAAHDGTGPFASSGPFGDLRGVASLYQEAITVIAGRDSGITTLPDIAGKRIDIGPPASGRRATANRLLAAMSFDLTAFTLVSELPTTTAIDELCAGRLDAVLLVIGHPDSNVAHALADCGARLVPLNDAPTAQTIGTLGSYQPQVIAAGVYPQLTGPVTTFGVTADLVTRSAIPVPQVKMVLRVLQTRQNALARMAPVLVGLDATNPWPDTTVLPAHRAIAAAQ